MTKYNSDVCYADNEQTRKMQMAIADLEATLRKLAEAAQAFLDATYLVERGEGNPDYYYDCEGNLQGILDEINPPPAPSVGKWPEILASITLGNQEDR